MDPDSAAAAPEQPQPKRRRVARGDSQRVFVDMSEFSEEETAWNPMVEDPPEEQTAVASLPQPLITISASDVSSESYSPLAESVRISDEGYQSPRGAESADEGCPSPSGAPSADEDPQEEQTAVAWLPLPRCEDCWVVQRLMHSRRDLWLCAGCHHMKALASQVRDGSWGRSTEEAVVVARILQRALRDIANLDRQGSAADRFQRIWERRQERVAEIRDRAAPPTP